jgi:hypothetical protein
VKKFDIFLYAGFLSNIYEGKGILFFGERFPTPESSFENNMRGLDSD